MPKKPNKPNVGFFSLTSCEGCWFAILDETLKFLELNKKINLLEFRLFQEALGRTKPNVFDGNVFTSKKLKLDIAIIEGSPITQENVKLLQEIRTRSKIVVGLSACSQLGSIQALKNYGDKDTLLKYVYPKFQNIDNPQVKPLDQIIKIDHWIPGCPINAADFYNFFNSIFLGKKYHLPEKPVCYDCQLRGYDCVLLRGEVCFGPIAQGGCEAVCLKSKQGCWGCRGLLENIATKKMMAPHENLKKHLLNIKPNDKSLQVFGAEENA